MKCTIQKQNSTNFNQTFPSVNLISVVIHFLWRNKIKVYTEDWNSFNKYNFCIGIYYEYFPYQIIVEM